MDSEKYVLMSIDNLTWSADFTAYDDISTARAAMKRQFDRDLEIALDKMGISHPEEIVYENYKEQFWVKKTENSLHVVFLSGDFLDDSIYEYCKNCRKNTNKYFCRDCNKNLLKNVLMILIVLKMSIPHGI